MRTASSENSLEESRRLLIYRLLCDQFPENLVLIQSVVFLESRQKSECQTFQLRVRSSKAVGFIAAGSENSGIHIEITASQFSFCLEGWVQYTVDPNSMRSGLHILLKNNHSALLYIYQNSTSCIPIVFNGYIMLDCTRASQRLNTLIVNCSQSG
ncbi:Hypothetical_protein [Hexamita inflata]|uniref:Hypothetical_protein n=1 Tax=Hexamita inflata TaxID=28002 RepID=A0AA86TSF8_9EUKA|nr:Hypothetical protein HINF_LOCUS12722 [Hexamita inflata]